MYTILAPVDGDEQRVGAQAEAITELPGTDEDVEVILLHVFDDKDIGEKTAVRQVGANGDAREHLAEAGLRVEEESRVGTAASEIVDAAEEFGVDLIVLGGRKRSPLGSALFGSVSQDVTLEANRPVMITGSIEREAEPTHRCQSCGEEYYTDPDIEIDTCRQCGGMKVEQLK